MQRMPLRMTAEFAAYFKRLEIALGGRVQVAEPEVDLAQIVQRDAAERGGTHRLKQVRRAPQIPSASSPAPFILRWPSPSAIAVWASPRVSPSSCRWQAPARGARTPPDHVA